MAVFNQLTDSRKELQATIKKNVDSLYLSTQNLNRTAILRMQLTKETNSPWLKAASMCATIAPSSTRPGESVTPGTTTP